MNIAELAERLQLTQEVVQRIEVCLDKISKSKSSYFCGSCTGEYFDWQLVDNHCPMCLSEDELEAIEY